MPRLNLGGLPGLNLAPTSTAAPPGSPTHLAHVAHLQGVLAAGGANFKNVVNMRVCLRDTGDFPKFNEAFTKFMDGEKVTRTCIGGTPHRSGVNVEIDCVAMLD